jgi:DNA-binding Xre family transcriptional regulator
MHNLQKYVHKFQSFSKQLGINILHQKEAESNKLQKLPVLARENLNILHVHTTKHSYVKIITLLSFLNNLKQFFTSTVSQSEPTVLFIQ